MKIALGVPGVGEVPAAFAYDLANLVGHLSTRFDVEVRILSADEELTDPVRESIIAAAQEWEADLMVFPKTHDRVPANLLDPVIEKMRAPKIEVVTPLSATVQ